MKHMKKSMFITTLAMVVVLVVALSTATFAWYSASTTVTASNTDLMSASSSSAAIAVSTNTITSSSTGVTATFTTDVVTGPMVPTINPQASTTYAAFLDCFKSAGIDTHNYFSGNGASAVPSTINTVSIDGAQAAEQSLFYVGNTNPGSNPTIQMRATIATTGSIYVLTASDPGDLDTNYANYYTKNNNGTFTALASAPQAWAASTYYKTVAISSSLANCLRIAVFIDGNYATTYGVSAAATNVGDATYMTQGAYAQYDAEHHGVENYGIAAQYNCVAANTATTVKACSGVDSASVSWIAWFDGCQLISDYAGAAVQFSFTFSVAA